MSEDTVLVTGGAGYIGSHVAHLLIDRGMKVVVVDNLSTGVQSAVPKSAAFYDADVGDGRELRAIMQRHQIASVMHFAGSIIVPESITNPLKYYYNNTRNTLEVINACIDCGVAEFIFSSTAAVYGDYGVGAVGEACPLHPSSPYGTSKLMSETMLRDVASAEGAFRFVCLRYFNVAGADPLGRTGQQGPESTHLVRVAIETAIGVRDELKVFGTDYDTRDGTCERDYIHVTDLADAHVRALEYLRSGGQSDVFNCGYGRGLTVREVISSVERVTGKPLKHAFTDRRPGDPARLVADSTKIRSQIGWAPRLDNIDAIIGSAYRWQLSLRASRVAEA